MIYVIESRSLQDNRRLLMLSGSRMQRRHSADEYHHFQLEAVNHQPPVQEMNWDQRVIQRRAILTTHSPETLAMRKSLCWASAWKVLSAAHDRVAVGLGDGGDGGDDDDNSFSYRKASDYVTEDNHSGSSSVHSDYDDNNADDALLADYDVNFSYLDGHSQ